MATATALVPRLLVVDDKESMRSLLYATFIDRGYTIDTAADGSEAIDLIYKNYYDIIITDLKMPEKDGIDVLKAARSTSIDTQVIVITAYGTMDMAVEAMRLGAYDIIAKPFQLAEIELKIDRILSETANAAIETDLSATEEKDEDFIVGNSVHTQNLLSLIQKIGPSKSSVLITGPTGVGKELVAKALHMASPLHDKPFVALNCAALAPGVLESELFGHEKGAFTGAVARRIGRFERAHGGTLFLDEVGDIDPSVQTKLLRVLQEGQIERVGGMESITVDVRIIAATNRELKQAIAEGSFREDFYYRINVFSILVEPLANRRADIPALVDLFLAQFAPEMDQDAMHIDDAVLEFFMKYTWPGNVRELENVLERATVLTENEMITMNELPPDLVHGWRHSDPPPHIPQQDDGLAQRTVQLEQDLILDALERFRWNKTKAAEHLGLKRTTLQYKIKKYNLDG
ncbi:MAG: sigma-54-dependent Fis family transcriptional regulator [Candidatus Hydrogenedentes bacterium]|nr:sigma-54-dependent Fis family transcriptional regulator [Candidatus Hydrogenedentota bacterium]